MTGALTFSWKRLLLFASLSLADLLLTWVLISQSNGAVYESNPIAGAVLAKFAWPGLAAFKFVAFAVVVCLAALIARQRPALGARVLTFACSTLGGVTIYSCSLLAKGSSAG
jgi:hypothetical protein